MIFEMETHKIFKMLNILIFVKWILFSINVYHAF